QLNRPFVVADGALEQFLGLRLNRLSEEALDIGVGQRARKGARSDGCRAGGSGRPRTACASFGSGKPCTLPDEKADSKEHEEAEDRERRRKGLESAGDRVGSRQGRPRQYSERQINFDVSVDLQAGESFELRDDPAGLLAIADSVREGDFLSRFR